MKFILTCLLSATFLFAQGQTKTYVSASGEMIFSSAKIKVSGNEDDATIRWSPVFNGQALVNHDFSNHMGLFYGLAYRNVGFIYKDSIGTNHKFRTYNLGIPIGIKIGNLDNGMFLFGGYEFEMPFNFKQKDFVNEQKSKYSVWFSDRVNWYTQSVFVGVNFKGGTSIKFKYYLENFFNTGYTETVGGVKVQPYKNLEVNIFYLSLAWNVFGSVNGYKNIVKGGTGSAL